MFYHVCGVRLIADLQLSFPTYIRVLVCRCVYSLLHICAFTSKHITRGTSTAPPVALALCCPLQYVGSTGGAQDHPRKTSTMYQYHRLITLMYGSTSISFRPANEKRAIRTYRVPGVRIWDVPLNEQDM